MKKLLFLLFLAPLLGFGQIINLSGHVTPADPMAPRDSIPVYILDSADAQLGQPPVITYTNPNGFYNYSYGSNSGNTGMLTFVMVWVDSCMGAVGNTNNFAALFYLSNLLDTNTFVADFNTCDSACDASYSTQIFQNTAVITFEAYDYFPARTYVSSGGDTVTTGVNIQIDSLQLDVTPDAAGNAWWYVDYGSMGCRESDTLSSNPGPSCLAAFVVDTVNSLNGNAVLWNVSTASPNASYLWDFGDGNTSTNPFPTHTYNAAGVFQVCLTVSDSGCTSTYCDSLGMDANGNLIYKGQLTGWTLVVLDPNSFSAADFEVGLFQIYPNPTTSYFQLDFANELSMDAKGALVDLTGRTVAQWNYEALKAQTLDVSHLPKGVYFFVFEDGKISKTQKLIIQ